MAARKKSTAKSKKKSTAKASVKKKVTKRAGSRKAAKRVVATKKLSPGSVSVGRKPFTKSEFITSICTQTGAPRKDVVNVLDAISCIIHAHVQKQGPEAFSWPGILKIQVVKKPATKARQGINPFTGESMLFKAKPASRRIKIRALKQLKAMAS